MKAILKSLVARTPYRVVRSTQGNRFDAVESSLRGMQSRGYSPKIIIDGGAHLGSFSLMANRIFPEASLHLIEPQRPCLDSLRDLCSSMQFTLHECALAENSGAVMMTAAASPNTGAFIYADGRESGHRVCSRTLDDIFNDQIIPQHRALLKLDLQGYEMHALRGGRRMLRSIEAILLEVSFFAQRYEPSIADIVAFLAENDFALYDVAALADRSRDNRLRQGDFIFVRTNSPLMNNASWD